MPKGNTGTGAPAIGGFGNQRGMSYIRTKSKTPNVLTGVGKTVNRSVNRTLNRSINMGVNRAAMQGLRHIRF